MTRLVLALPFGAAAVLGILAAAHELATIAAQIRALVP